MGIDRRGGCSLGKIHLKAHKKYYLLEDKFFIVKSGKVVTKSIAANGKVISNNTCLREGELVFNCFKFLSNGEMNFPEIQMEIEALEETTLEEFVFCKKGIVNNEIYKNVFLHLVQKVAIELLYQLYDTKGYILMILKLYANSKGIFNKKEIKPENFNVGKTQFYKIYLHLKNEEYLIEEHGEVYLNLLKIDNYLLELEC